VVLKQLVVCDQVLAKALYSVDKQLDGKCRVPSAPGNDNDGGEGEIMNLHELAVMDVDWEDDEACNMDEHRLMERYPDDDRVPQYVAITEIIVPSERDKDQLLRAIKYLHDNRTIDTDYYAVNSLVHMYEAPDRIKVRS
jgi:hypothetical protein